jgi:imidazolonepropionase-like amidohydrolase
MSEDAALATVTLNPAIQLGIDARVGSIDVGKDADFALFSRHPFDVETVCRMTFVDGELVFQRRDGVWDEWAADVDRRIAEGRQAQAAAPPGAERTALEKRARDVPAASLESLALPRQATRSPSTPSRPAPPALALVGGTVHTGEREHAEPVVYAPGVVLLKDGRIQGVYAGDGRPPEGFEIVDVTGLHVWSGLIDAGTSIGLQEIESVAGTMDVDEIGQDQPDLRASTGWHADSAHIAVARVNGITSALIVPGGQRVQGQSSAMALEGWTASEAVIRDAVALHVVAPRTERKRDKKGERPERALTWADSCMSGVPGPAGPRAGDDDDEDEKKDEDEDKPLAERVDAAWKDLRTMFEDAREYARASGEAKQRGVPGPDHDPRLEALAPYAIGAAPVVFEASAADTIADALDFAVREGLRPIIAGGLEAWKVADRLALHDVPVILGPVLAMPPTREDLYDAPFTNASLLHRAGVRFCFRSADSSTSRNLPYNAGMAVAFGLPEDAAMAALTSDAAAILGLSGEVGVLAPGLRADVIVTDGSPLQIRTAIKRVIIGGRDVGLESRHTQLYERYRARLQDPGRPSQ